MSGRWGANTVQNGVDEIVAALSAEAEAYERGSGVIDEEHLLTHAEVQVSGSTATPF